MNKRQITNRWDRKGAVGMEDRKGFENKYYKNLEGGARGMVVYIDTYTVHMMKKSYVTAFVFSKSWTFSLTQPLTCTAVKVSVKVHIQYRVHVLSCVKPVR